MKGADSRAFDIDLGFSPAEEEPVEAPVVDEVEDDEDEVVTEPPVVEDSELDEPIDEDEEPSFEGVTGSALLARSYKNKGYLPEDFEIPDNFTSTQLEEAVLENLSKEADSMAVERAKAKGLDDSVLEYAEFIAKGGNVQDLQIHNVYGRLADYYTSTEEGQELIMTAMLQEQGNTDKNIERIIESLKLDDELEENSKEAKQFFSKRRDEYFADLKQQQKEVEEQAKKASERQAEQFRDIIRKGELNGNKLSKLEAKQLEKQFLDPTEVVVLENPDGTKTKTKVTAFQKRIQEIQSDPQKTLELAHLILTGLDNVKTKAKGEARDELLSVLDAKKKYETVETPSGRQKPQRGGMKITEAMADSRPLHIRSY